MFVKIQVKNILSSTRRMDDVESCLTGFIYLKSFDPVLHKHCNSTQYPRILKVISNMSETEEYSGCLIFYVNSKKVVDENPDPGETLLSYLRNKLRLVGVFLSREIWDSLNLNKGRLCDNILSLSSLYSVWLLFTHYSVQWKYCHFSVLT